MKKHGNGSGMMRKLPDKTYEYRVSYGYDKNGKRIQKSFYGKLQEDCRDKKREYDKKSPQLSKITTVAEWAPQWLTIYKEGKISIDQVKQYRGMIDRYIIPELGNMKLNKVLPAQIQEFMNKYRDSSKSHLSKMKMVLSGIFDTAVDNYFCDRNPVPKVKIEGTESSPEYFSETETDQIIQYCFENRSNITDAIFTLLYTGLRREEILGLMWNDIDLQKNIIHIRRCIVKENAKMIIKEEMKTKDSLRDIPILDPLKTFMATMPRNSLYVFPGSSGGPIYPDVFSKAYMAVLKRIEVRPLTAHKCRHTFASRLLAAGVDIKIIQAILGHSDIKMTGNVYTHVDAIGVGKALSKFTY